ncbi:TerD family protein [Deinococcus sp. HMF7620]|uniref:TerD family protein n=1 Tax=Deinococcus arboris TaxID=2682977 RepID=A0A7C9LUX0_9DEIO|nr:MULTISPECIES: TerD family protein [Deinococcus]MBZ9749763.1 tellurium resistance TerZ family protein [Deinococcus betulae]MVN87580.1 TerD family protein [Deinococcus arboris]
MALSLKKGEQISLAKTSGTTLTAVRMGVGWEGIKKKGLLGFGAGREAVDLDANALMFDASGTLVDQVWFRQLQSKDGSVRHSGDNRTGDGAGDDETITIHLNRLPQNVVTVILSVNNYSGQSFNRIETAYCRLINEQGEKELARYELAGQGDHNGLIMASLKREGTDWTFKAIGAPASGRTYHDNLPDMRAHL